jgi:hypothetical protein
MLTTEWSVLSDLIESVTSLVCIYRDILYEESPTRKFVTSLVYIYRDILYEESPTREFVTSLLCKGFACFAARFRIFISQ